MKQFLSLILLLCFLSVVVNAEVEYSSKPASVPGLYFVENIYSPAISFVQTNTEERMWYPSLVSITQSSLLTNTITFVVDHIISTNEYRGDVVWTNDIDEVLTNYSWGVTNVLVLTNSESIGTLVVSGVSSGKISFSDAYLQKGDVLRVTFSTNATWMRIIAKE